MPGLDLDPKMPELRGPDGSKKGEVSKAVEKIFDGPIEDIREAIKNGEAVIKDEYVNLPTEEKSISHSSMNNKHSNMNPPVFPDLRKTDVTPEKVEEISERLEDSGLLERPEPKMVEDIQFLSPEEREEIRKNYISTINSLEETIKNGETDLKKAITENNLQPLGALDVLLKTRKLDPGEFQLGKNILARAGIKNVSDAQELALEFLRDHYAELLNKDK